MDLSNENIIHVKGKYLEYLQFRKLNELGIKHAYTLKNKGYNFKNHGDPTIPDRSYKVLCEELEIDYDKLIRPNQTHTNVVKCVDKVPSFEEIDNVDGVITDKSGLSLATTNADCILYLLYDPKRRVVGSIHSGWKGTYQRIIENAIDEMISVYNCNHSDIYVFICPSIRKCHFEVNDDVKDMFEERFKFTGKLDEIIFDGKVEGKYYIDTVHLNNILLKEKGIDEEKIIDSGLCSVCNSDIIGSYRVEGKFFTGGTAIISL